MRITNKQVYLTVLRNVQRPAKRMLELQTQLSSGRKINRYSDDPLAAGEVEQFRGKRANAAQYASNIDDGLVWMRQTEAMLDQVESDLMRAKSLAVQAANGTVSSDDRLAIAREVNQLLEDVLSAANGQFRDRYLFAGVHTTARPFVEMRDSDGKITSITRSSDASGEVTRTVADGVDIQVNIPGDEVFSLTDGPLAALLDLRDRLESNDIEGIQESLTALDDALEKSLTARTTLGARMQRMETMRQSLETTSVNLEATIAELQDADIAELTMRLSADEVSYRTAIGAAARIMQTNLVDILT